jgi:hypothetical protein
MKQLQLEVLRGPLLQQYATMLLDAMLEGPDPEGPDAPLPAGMPDLASMAGQEGQTEKREPRTT